MELYPHQLEAVENLRNGSILWGGVGSGKSITAVAYYMEQESPKDLYIITTAKKRDDLEWDKEAAHYGIGKEADATLAGVLTVDSWNNIGKYTDVVGAFFIFDEQRLVGNGAWAKAFIKISKSNNWILLSATPGDSWMDYISVFIANGFYKNRAHFLREHVVFSSWSKFPKVERYLNEKKLLEYKSRVLVHMPYLMHTKRVVETVNVRYDVQKYYETAKIRWNPYTLKPVRNSTEMVYVLRRMVNSNSDRFYQLCKIWKEKRRVIVFYNFDYELETLRSMEAFTTVAEWNGHKHEPIPDTETWVYLVQYTAGSEGWNCIDTDTIVFYSLPYSYKHFHQAHGRIDRLNVPFLNLFYFYFVSESKIDKMIMQSLKKKKSFNEQKLVEYYEKK